VLGESDDGRCCPCTFDVLDHTGSGGLALHDGDARVGGTKIDTDDRTRDLRGEIAAVGKSSSSGLVDNTENVEACDLICNFVGVTGVGQYRVNFVAGNTVRLLAALTDWTYLMSLPRWCTIASLVLANTFKLCSSAAND
jgi:hypothetical protein